MKTIIFVILSITLLSSCLHEPMPKPIENYQFIKRVINSPDSLVIFVKDTSVSAITKYNSYTKSNDTTLLIDFKKQLKAFQENDFRIFRIENNIVDSKTNKRLQALIMQDKKSEDKITFLFIEDEKGHWKIIGLYDYDYLYDERYKPFPSFEPGYE